MTLWVVACSIVGGVSEDVLFVGRKKGYYTQV